MAVFTPSDAQLQNFDEARDATSPNDTVPVHSFEVSGTETDIDAAFVPKGAGAVTVHITDGTSTGGDKRGANAVDLQSLRSSSSHVASGAGAAIPGGEGNTASGTNSFTAGYDNQATSTTSIAVGDGCVSSGVFSVAIGNWAHATANSSMCLSTGDSYAEAQYSVAIGAGADTRNTIGKLVYSSTSFSTVGYGTSQMGHHVLAALTTDATTTIPTSNWSTTTTPDSSNVVALPDDHAFQVTANIVARDTSTGDAKAWKIEGLVKRGSGASTVALVGTPTKTVIAEDTGTTAWTADLVADTTRGSVEVEVTGEASTTVRWACKIDTVEVG